MANSTCYSQSQTTETKFCIKLNMTIYYIEVVQPITYKTCFQRAVDTKTSKIASLSTLTSFNSVDKDCVSTGNCCKTCNAKNNKSFLNIYVIDFNISADLYDRLHPKPIKAFDNGLPTATFECAFVYNMSEKVCTPLGYIEWFIQNDECSNKIANTSLLHRINEISSNITLKRINSMLCKKNKTVSNDKSENLKYKFFLYFSYIVSL